MPKAGAVKIGTDKMRAPRAHPQTVVFTFGARKNQELPFVIGVMSDLAGKPKEALPPVSKRQFLDIDSGNMSARMAAMKPRAAFQVPNVMSAEGGNMSVDLEFRSMDDFKPDRVAAQVEPLRKLLEQRQRLQDLINYLGANQDAEAVLEELLGKVEALTKAAK
jgi:type VI secretion system protein ImpB